MPQKPLSPKYLVQLLVILLLFFAHTIQSNPHTHKNAFGFIQNLKGCHKGQNTSGLHHLKQYLQKFGYLSYDSHKNLHATDDEFDDVLESAVKTYQRTFHLRVTGTLDDPTVAQMSVPRCGFPDNTNKSTTKLPNKHHHIHGVSHYKFFPGAPRWPASKTRLTYRFTAGAIPASAAARAACARAFDRWRQVSHFTFQEVSGGAADIQIAFHRGNHGDGAENAFDGPGGVFAHAANPPHGLFHYDATERWSANPSGPSEIDLESVAVHEIGHVLGLAHEEGVSAAIMYPYFAYGTVKRALHEDDIRGIRALYGLNA